MKSAKGNMYGFITHTWNPIKGRCSHSCRYCYMKRFKQNELRFDQKEVNENLGIGNFIFVCSGTDLFAKDVNPKWIEWVIINMKLYPINQYLLQSKNPARMYYYRHVVPKNTIFCTTIESNRNYDVYGESPPIEMRYPIIEMFRQEGFQTMITIEPVMEFDLDDFVKILLQANPQKINIGADSKGHKLVEPPKNKIIELIEILTKNGIEVNKKSNIKRIIGEF